MRVKIDRKREKFVKPQYRHKQCYLTLEDVKTILSALTTEAIRCRARWTAEGGKPAEIAMGMADFVMVFDKLTTQFNINADLHEWIKTRSTEKGDK